MITILPPLPCVDHLLRGGLAGVVDAELRDLDRAQHMLPLRLDHQLADREGRVGHHHIDMAEVRHASREQRGDLRAVGDVGVVGQRPAAQRLDLRDRPARAQALARRQVVHDDVGALLGQAERHATPDPARRAGDERHFSGKALH